MELPRLAELNRRRVFRALVGYGIAAFALLQIIEPVMHGLHWPEAVLSYTVVALALGFPIVVALAWIFDVKAGGIERTTPASTIRGPRLTLVLICIGLLAAAPGVVWYFFIRGIARPAAEDRKSIAVLPFANLSSDKDQEYFSDGISDEIRNALAQLEGLRVAGRTSSFYFKGKNEDLASIADKLHVGTLLEGSVRKSGQQVRITAQLIDAKDGYELWSKQYDRNLTDIFNVQAEVATAVVEVLQVRLLPGTSVGTKIRPARDPEAYRLFLLGRSLDILGTRESQQRAATLLEKAVALEPSYAPAWEWLAYSIGNLAMLYSGDQAKAAYHRAREAAERAISLDPGYFGGWTARGWIRANFFWEWSAAQGDHERALALSANTGEPLNGYAIFLTKQGRVKEALPFAQKFADLDPLNAIAWSNLAYVLMVDRQFDAARDADRHSLEISPENPATLRDLTTIDLVEGRAAQALEEIEKLPPGNDKLMGLAIAQHTLGRERQSLEALEALAAEPEGDVAYMVAVVHACRGERDAAFESLERAYARHDLNLRFVKVDPLLRNVRGDARYGALLYKMNLPLE